MGPMPRAVLFDLDNTLVDRDAAWRATLDARCPDLTEDLRARVLQADGHGRRPRAEYVDWLARHAPQVLPKAGWASLADQIAARTRAFEEVPAALDQVQACFRTAVVSDGGLRVQRAKLRASGLGSRFEVVVISEQLGVNKPAPAPFLAALEALDVPPERAWFVGDHPVCDVAGAAALGMTTVWRRHGEWPAGQAPRPTHVVDDLLELPALLSRPFPARS